MRDLPDCQSKLTTWQDLFDVARVYDADQEDRARVVALLSSGRLERREAEHLLWQIDDTASWLVERFNVLSTSTLETLPPHPTTKAQDQP